MGSHFPFLKTAERVFLGYSLSIREPCTVRLAECLLLPGPGEGNGVRASLTPASRFRCLLRSWKAPLPSPCHPLLLSGGFSRRRMSSRDPGDDKYLLSSLRCCHRELILNRAILPAIAGSCVCDFIFSEDLQRLRGKDTVTQLYIWFPVAFEESGPFLFCFCDRVSLHSPGCC